MKKKIIIITLTSSILSILIYFYTKSDEINIVALGDGISLGMTPYGIEGTSYNDYLKNEYETKHKLNNYYDFSEFGATVKELIYDIKENKTLIIKNEEIEIQRAINEANILTICIGMDELSEDRITSSMIKDYEHDINELLSMIKMLNHHQVIVLGLYTIKPQEMLSIARLNGIIRDVALINNFTFIDISSNLNNPDFYPDKSSYYLNYKGHQTIYELVKKEISIK